MLQPYQPGKIPVLMVHGLWSSPLTWMEMFNDLRSDPEIRDHFQFWFYLYPTGVPFWTTATRLRRDLAETRALVDPTGSEAALDQMVLVGHSMGGLVSKLQTVDSGDDFWRIVSDRPFQELKTDPATRARLEELFFFRPNPSIRRVVTIGTPHLGSKFASGAVRYVGQKLIELPQMALASQQQVYRDNRELFRDDYFLQVRTSLDSLSPESPIFPVLRRARTAPWVRFHTIIGVLPDEGLIGSLAGGTDGIVAYESARLENAESEYIVNAHHSAVHRHPLCVLEVKRILLAHLAECYMGTRADLAERPEELPPVR
jgi:pimeloyl-ACP methyl ester carboxylesterase